MIFSRIWPFFSIKPASKTFSPHTHSAYCALALIFSIALISCSTAEKPFEGIEESRESNFEASHNPVETLIILGTNDLHGALAPLSLKTRETGKKIPTQYNAAGASVLASYIKKLRSEYKERFLWLDAGDEFQGTIESNLEQGAPMVTFFNALGLNAAAVGNHEFDFGLDSLKSRMQEAQYTFLSANMMDRRSAQADSNDAKMTSSFPNLRPHLLLRAGRLKVGIIGLSTLDTPKTTRAEYVRSLEFADLKSTTMREAETLRQLGADIIVITAHAGLKCEPGPVIPSPWVRKSTDPQGKCGEQDEIPRLLHSLPPGTVDAVVSGHTHQVIHHWIAGVPVIQGGMFGRYLNIIHLDYDLVQKKVLTERTRIEGPVPVCAQIFKNQRDCNGDRPAPRNGRGPLIPAHFRGQVMQPDSQTQALLGSVFKKSEAAQARVIGTAARPIEHNWNLESALGNLAADAIRQAAGTDVAYVNRGGIRAPLEAGPVTYEAIFRAFPFENSIARLKVTGEELKLILRVAESGSRGFGSVSGIRLKLVDPAFEGKFDDLNGNGKNEPWKINRLLEASINEEPIQDQKLYTFATLDFLVTGGDDLGWPMSRIPPDRIDLSTGMIMREALVQYILKKNKPLNSVSQPLYDPAHPRLKFEKPEVPEKFKRKKRSRKRKS